MQSTLAWSEPGHHDAFAINLKFQSPILKQNFAKFFGELPPFEFTPVRRSRQQHYFAGTPLAHSVPAPQVHHCATAGGLYQFFRSTSCNIARSSVSSATNFFSLPFSSCSCLS
jgi:hypothetical protein